MVERELGTRYGEGPGRALTMCGRSGFVVAFPGLFFTSEREISSVAGELKYPTSQWKLRLQPPWYLRGKEPAWWLK